ncbi:TPA: hypothetical protein ACIE4J_001316, partial [Streptococcus pyogenes]
MNKTKQNKTKQNKTKQNKTKQNKTKHSLLCRYGLTSAAALLLTFGGAIAVKADGKGIREMQERLSALREGFPDVEEIYKSNSVNKETPYYKYLEKLDKSLRDYLEELDKNLHQLKGDQGERGEAGPQGPAGQDGKAGDRGETGPA